MYKKIAIRNKVYYMKLINEVEYKQLLTTYKAVINSEKQLEI